MNKKEREKRGERARGEEGEHSLGMKVKNEKPLNPGQQGNQTWKEGGKAR